MKKHKYNNIKTAALSDEISVSEYIANKALLESYRHWEDNVESYPWRMSWHDKLKWFNDNCGIFQCPLCILFNNRGICINCPMGKTTCFKEYNKLCDCINGRTSRKHHVEAARDRLKDECEKRGLL